MVFVIPNKIKLNKSKNLRQKSVKTASGGRYAAHLCEAAVPAVTANWRWTGARAETVALWKPNRARVSRVALYQNTKMIERE